MAADAFAGQVAVITGAANGIGAAVAKELSSAGARVVLADVDDAAGTKLSEALDGLFVRTDVTDPDANIVLIKRALDEYGRIDLVHLNAGVVTGTGIGEGFDPVTYRRAMAVNLDGVVYGVQAALEHLLVSGTGQIIVTASMAGLTTAPFDAIYAANKSAVVALVRSLGALHTRSGVRINALCPSFAETDIIADIRQHLIDTSFPILPVDAVVEAFMAIATGEGTGDAWYVVPGRASEPFVFRNVPGPRSE